ncbi:MULTISPECIES: DUF6318 family protein [unclassified Ornithinimicrobium]|uniref:DUF6318 family protein n=1 Tax=unclassified Ornithinimicrobium TaxID=2615080 RepID=UPI003851F035
MRPAAYVAAALAALVLTGCGGGAEPSAPPTSEPALTTATATPDEVVETSEAAATTAEPTEAAGPPKMPEEAKEQTEAGAEAFVLHYIDLINYTGMHPEVGLLEQNSTNNCGTCLQFSESVAKAEAEDTRQTGPIAEMGSPTSVVAGTSAVVTVKGAQQQVDVLNAEDEVVETYPRQDDVVMEFNLLYDGSWRVDRLFLVEEQ